MSATQAASSTTPDANDPDDAVAGAASESGARWDAKDLLGSLLDRRILTVSGLPRLLGPDRHRLTVARLERALERQHVLRDEDLLELKVKVSGLEPAPALATPILDIPPDKARKLMAVALKPDDGSRPVVAVVHDDPTLLRAVAELMEAGPQGFDVRITTLRTLSRWLIKLSRPSARIMEERSLPTIWQLLDKMVTDDGSDLHLVVGDAPAMRISGELHHLPTEPVTSTWIQKALMELTGRNLSQEFEGHTDINEAVSFGQHRFRLIIARGNSGPTLVARKLSTHVPDMASLNLPPSVQELVGLERGLVLVTGSTGSGKSTTLAAILAQILKSHPRKVITLEDPIEYQLGNGRGVVDQRELKSDFPTFDHAVSQALRQDPDVILIGEMRDAQTVRAAVEAAETGHLVFSTLHTFDAASALQRIIDFFEGEEQAALRAMLSYVLRAVIAQTLLPKIGGGRVAAFEVLLGTNAIRNQLGSIEGMKQIRGIMAMSSRDGMVTMEQYLARLVKARQVSFDEALFKAPNKEEFQQLVEG